MGLQAFMDMSLCDYDVINVFELPNRT